MFFDEAVALNDQVIKIGNLTVHRSKRMQNDKLKVGGHAMLLQRIVMTDQINLGRFGKVVQDFVEEKVYPMVGLKPKFYPHKETFFGHNGVHRIF